MDFPMRASLSENESRVYSVIVARMKPVKYVSIY